MKAAIDIGTNSLRMLIGEIHEGKVKMISQSLETTRLGEGMAKKLLLPQAIERTISALENFKKELNIHKVSDISIVATSAVRDATNRQEFLDKIFSATGWQVQVLSGEEEARLSFNGALSAKSESFGMPIIIDIGGGSTEVVYKKSDDIKGVSVNVGCVRLLEGNWDNELLKKELSPVVQPLLDYKGDFSVRGVGGTTTTLAAILYGVENYTREAVHGKVLPLSDIISLKNKLENMSLEERKKIPGLMPQRADIIVHGISILITLLNLLGAEEIIASDAGILDGVLLD